MRSADSTWWVYFVRDTTCNLIKIGVTTNDPRNRVKRVMAGNPHPTEAMGIIEGDETTESIVHHRFAHLRRHREWFHAGGDLLSFITDNASPLPPAPVYAKSYHHCPVCGRCRSVKSRKCKWCHSDIPIVSARSAA
jgi:hypothetical protein